MNDDDGIFGGADKHAPVPGHTASSSNNDTTPRHGSGFGSLILVFIVLSVLCAALLYHKELIMKIYYAVSDVISNHGAVEVESSSLLNSTSDHGVSSESVQGSDSLSPISVRPARYSDTIKDTELDDVNDNEEDDMGATTSSVQMTQLTSTHKTKNDYIDL